jgi:hypothetical protein
MKSVVIGSCVMEALPAIRTPICQGAMQALDTFAAIPLTKMLRLSWAAGVEFMELVERWRCLWEMI